MIAVAQFLVYEQGLDTLPYFHQRVWITNGWDYAIVELADWKQETEAEKHVSLHCFSWWIEERSDIGISHDLQKKTIRRSAKKKPV